MCKKIQPNLDDIDWRNSMDNVNRPAHYADKQIEVIDYIKDTLTAEQYEGYCRGLEESKSISRLANRSIK